MNDSSDNLFEKEPPAIARLLGTAHRLVFTEGYTAFTMDELAHELGMSKKTLYVHFPAKDAIIERIIDALGSRLRARMDAVVSDPKLSFTEKVAGVVAAASTTLGRVSPAMLRELQRNAPGVYQKLEDIRQRTIPVIFGRLIRDGIAEGMVRPDIDPAFATEFWLQAIRGMVQPAVLERTQLSIPQTLHRALHLFFAGLLTPAGRKTYEKHA
jgi:AcrR family transcriptional regulator